MSTCCCLTRIPPAHAAGQAGCPRHAPSIPPCSFAPTLAPSGLQSQRSRFFSNVCTWPANTLVQRLVGAYGRMSHTLGSDGWWVVGAVGVEGGWQRGAEAAGQRKDVCQGLLAGHSRAWHAASAPAFASACACPLPLPPPLPLHPTSPHPTNPPWPHRSVLSMEFVSRWVPSGDSRMPVMESEWPARLMLISSRRRSHT